MRTILLTTTALAWASLAALPAWAQAQAPTALDEVIVTATKREQNLQNVPLAVSAYGADALRKAGVEDARQLMSLSPSLNLTTTTSDSAGVAIRLRGLGSEAINPGLESSVATFVDGVYRSRSNLSLAAIPGIERIEVLRGPQGTLFGKNTSAGLISVITRSPGFEPSADAAVSLGNYNYQQYVLGLTGPLKTDVLAGRLDAAYTRRDGWLTDFTTGKAFRDKNQYSLRGQLLWQPTKDFDARLIVDTAHYDQQGPDTYAPKYYDPAYVAQLQAFGGLTHLGLDGLHNTLTSTRESREANRQWGASIEAHWNLGFGKITAITGYRDWSNRQAREVDYSQVDLVYIPYGAARQAFRTFTQEVRIDGEAGPLSWMAGGFFSNEDMTANYGYRVGSDLEAYYDRLLAGATGQAHAISFYTGLPVGQSLPAGTGYGLQQFDQSARSLSLFTHNTYNLTDRLSITAGLRYTRETKSLDVNFANAVNPGCSALIAQGRADTTPVSGIVCLQLWDPRYQGRYHASKREAEWSGLLTAAYAFSDDLNGYATFSRGYKAGGFVIDPSGFRLITAGPPNANDMKFNPEYAENLEVGLKARLLDRRLTLNTAAFRTKLTDYQLSYNTGSALLTRNIPEVVSTGVEVEAQVRVTHALSGALNLAYADASYGSFPASLGLPASIAALAGRRLHNAPLWTVTTSAGWDDTILSGRLRAFVHADARYQSAVMTERTLRAHSDQGAYTTADLRLGLGAPDEAWTLEAWSRNVTNARYFVSSIPATFQGGTLVGTPGEPRTYGLTLRARW